MFNLKILQTKNQADGRDFWRGERRVDSRFDHTVRRRKGAKESELQQIFGVSNKPKIVFTPGLNAELGKPENKVSPN
jgi:hypothetical protein